MMTIAQPVLITLDIHQLNHPDEPATHFSGEGSQSEFLSNQLVKFDRQMKDETVTTMLTINADSLVLHSRYPNGLRSRLILNESKKTAQGFMYENKPWMQQTVVCQRLDMVYHEDGDIEIEAEYTLINGNLELSHHKLNVSINPLETVVM